MLKSSKDLALKGGISYFYNNLRSEKSSKKLDYK